MCGLQTLLPTKTETHVKLSIVLDCNDESYFAPGSVPGRVCHANIFPKMPEPLCFNKAPRVNIQQSVVVAGCPLGYGLWVFEEGIPPK